MNEDLIKQHGLTMDEFKIIQNYLKRDLSIEELGIFSGQGGWSHEAIVISDQLQIQLTAVVATAAYTALATFVILKIVDVVTGLRVDSQTETQGLDLDSHGETGYNL